MDDVNVAGNDIRTIERNVNVLIKACKDICLALKMEVGRHRLMMANEHIKVGSNSYPKVKTF